MQAEPNIMPLTAVPRALRDLTGQTVTYQQLWAAATAGSIPAERHAGHWVVRPDRLRDIAKHFGLKVRRSA